MKVQREILEKWKENKILVFVLYREMKDKVTRLKGRIIDFDENTITISSRKNYLIISREDIIKIKGVKWEQ